MQGLVLIGSPTCGPCARAGAWLEQGGFRFRKLMIDGDNDLQQWVESQTGQRTIPQFFLNGQWITGGFPAVQQLAQAGQLPRG